MRSLAFAAVLAASFLCTSGIVKAQTRLAEVPLRYLVIPPSDGGTKRIASGEIAFEFPLRWENAAVLAQSVDVAADDRRATLSAGQALALTRLQFDDRTYASASSYCVPRLADPDRKLPLPGMFGLVGRAIARSASDGQFCLIDHDNDGKLDHSVLVNAGSPQARKPRRISEVSYKLIPGAVVSEGDSMRLRYGDGAAFELQIIQQGKARIFHTLSFKQAGRRHSYSPVIWGSKRSDGTYVFEAPGMTFTARDYDKSNRSMMVTWPATLQPAVIPIPDDVKIR